MSSTDSPAPETPEPQRASGPQEGFVPYPAWDEPDPPRPEQATQQPPVFAPGQDMAVVPQYVVAGKVRVDPLTGETLSPHNRWAAAFLQLFLGPIGAGRFYIGDQRTGLLSMAILVFCILMSVLQPPFFWLLWIIFGLWCVADFLMMISGNMRDADGRKLR